MSSGGSTGGGIYTDQNGVYVYSKGSRPDLPDYAPPFNFQVLSQFGFKLVNVALSSGAAPQWYWAAASESDYRASEGQRLGIDPAQVTVGASFPEVQGCYAVGPNDCVLGCDGTIYFCNSIYNSAQNYYYCACS
jgi:hypothetical protein